VTLISASTNDYTGHWAEATIQKWLDAGMATGYTDGTFKPDNLVTRAEFVKLVNGIIDYDVQSDISFTDVKSEDWFYHAVGVAENIEYINGYSTTEFGPNDYITREQAGAILSRIQYLDSSEEDMDKFTDKDDVSDWFFEEIGAATEAGFIDGYDDGTFKPQNNLTRAEAVKMLDNILVNSENMVVYEPSAQVADTIIEGDLIIAKTVGEGDVYLTNVEVKGTVKVLGGGANSLHFDSSKVAKIVVSKSGVRLVLDDGTVVEEISVGMEATLDNVGGEVAKVVVSGDGTVTLSGTFSNVTVEGSGDLTLSDTEIENLVVESPISILGSGTITNLTANVDGIEYDSDVEASNVTTAEGVSEPTESDEDSSTSSSSSSSSSGSSSSSSNPTIRITVTTSGTTKVFNTDDYSKSKKIHDAIIGIIDDGSYEDVIESYLDKINSRLDDIQVGEVEGVEDILDRFKEYVPDSMDVSALDTVFEDDEITSIYELDDLINVFEEASTEELNQIIDDLEADDFEDIDIYYDGDEVTYEISNTGDVEIPSSKIGIADFVLNDILDSDEKVGDFFDDYGTVTLTVTSESGQTTTLTLSLH
jgi:hypothetical protein